MGMSTDPQSVREPDAADGESFDGVPFDDDDVDDDGVDELDESLDPEPVPLVFVASVDGEDFSSFGFPPPDLPRLSVL
jgi:hypothetical protein